MPNPDRDRDSGEMSPEVPGRLSMLLTVIFVLSLAALSAGLQALMLSAPVMAWPTNRRSSRKTNQCDQNGRTR